MISSSPQVTAAGRRPLTNYSSKQPARKLVIQSKDFSNADQAIPIRNGYGRHFVSGTYFTPIFGFSATAITQQTGK